MFGRCGVEGSCLWPACSPAGFVQSPVAKLPLYLIPPSAAALGSVQPCCPDPGPSCCPLVGTCANNSLVFALSSPALTSDVLTSYCCNVHPEVINLFSSGPYHAKYLAGKLPLLLCSTKPRLPPPTSCAARRPMQCVLPEGCLF